MPSEADTRANYIDPALKEDKYCENGDLLFSWSGTPGTSFGAFIWGGEKGIFHYHIWNMKPIVELNLQFGYWLLRHLTNEAISNSRGVAGMLHITKGMMENFKVNRPAPSRTKQDRRPARRDLGAHPSTDRRHQRPARKAPSLKSLPARRRLPRAVAI